MSGCANFIVQQLIQMDSTRIGMSNWLWVVFWIRNHPLDFWLWGVFWVINRKDFGCGACSGL